MRSTFLFIFLALILVLPLVTPVGADEAIEISIVTMEIEGMT
jgi:hypothetical protein